MDDCARLDPLVHAWRTTADDVVVLLRDLDDADWDRPTDLPGWDVRAVAAHLAHIESSLAGDPQDEVEVPGAPHVDGLFARFTEAGPVARRHWPTGRIVDQLEDAVERRTSGLRDDPPADLDAPGPGFAGAVGWSWARLLGNRGVDLWMHEQDIRRATDRPGGLTGPGAAHVLATFAAALPYVVGKRAGAAPGSTVVVEVTEAPGATGGAASYGVTVGDDGRGAALPEPPADPTVRLRMGFEDFVVLSGGRRPPGSRAVEVSGDQGLGARVLAGMAVTP